MKLIDLERNARLYTEVPQATLLEHYAVLVYEVGALGKCLVYERRNGEVSSIGEIKVAIGDSHVQLKMISEMLNLDTSELLSLGEEHLKERLKQAKETFKEGKGWY